MQSLFPTNSGSDGLAALLTVPAGKCNMVRITNSAKYTVTADKRRGNISLVKGADGLIHFRWANGSNGNIEDDRMIFPG